MSALKAKAEHGDPSAQFAFGRAFENGNGVARNDDLAFKWYRKAAEQGNASAESQVGVMYGLGRGVDQDKAEAVRWYYKAAKHGSSLAMFNLGASYYNGDGVPSNATLSYAWFLLAREAGDSSSEDAVNRSAQTQGQSGTTEALVQVAEMYMKGEELPQSYPEAAKWYEKASENSPKAEVALAGMFINGQGVIQDYGRAMALCEHAVKSNYAPGAFCVGYLYGHGLGTPADAKKAAKFYEQASAGQYPPAMMALAEMYSKGDGITVDRPEAYYYLFCAALKGVPNAKPQALVLWKELNDDDLKRLKKILKQKSLDSKKIFAYMQDSTTRARETLPAP